MTEVVGESLQLVSREVAVVPEDVVVARPARPLDPLVRHQIEVALHMFSKYMTDISPCHLCWVIDPLVHHSPGQGVPVLVLVAVGGEEPERSYNRDKPH